MRSSVLRSTLPAVAPLLRVLLAPASVARAEEPIRWEGNNHWYEVVPHTSGVSWSKARDEAKLKGGHLVTITSENEQTFVDSLLALVNPPTGAVYIGLEEKSEGVWSWVTDEKLDYTRWHTNQPDNAFSGESRGSLLWNHETPMKGRDAFWNDIADAPQGGTCDYCGAGSSIIEYSIKPRSKEPKASETPCV